MAAIRLHGTRGLGRLQGWAERNSTSSPPQIAPNGALPSVLHPDAYVKNGPTFAHANELIVGLITCKIWLPGPLCARHVAVQKVQSTHLKYKAVLCMLVPCLSWH